MSEQFFNTAFTGIMVKADQALHPMFVPLVKEALDKIYSKPVGRQLIDDIQTRGAAKYGFKVAIRCPQIIRASAPAVLPDFSPGSSAKRAMPELDACWIQGQPRGKGAVTSVIWNPNVIASPDGARPAFIGLAHELVHARRNLLGIASRDDRMEEEHTVGLNLTGDGVTENAIRAEHGVPARARYGFPDGDIVDDFIADFGHLGPHIG
jgi:hypothetical protein